MQLHSREALLASRTNTLFSAPMAFGMLGSHNLVVGNPEYMLMGPIAEGFVRVLWCQS